MKKSNYYKISHCVPALVYDRINIHTSLATYQVKNGFKPDKSVLQQSEERRVGFEF